GAESDPKAEFARSTRNGVCHDAIKPDSGKQSGQSAEYRREAGHQSLGSQRDCNLLAHGLQSNNRDMRVELPHAFANFILDLARIGLRPQIDGHEAEVGVFEVREVGLRRRSLTQISAFSVRNHPNYFNVRGDWFHVVHEPEALPDWISAREVLLGKA